MDERAACSIAVFDPLTRILQRKLGLADTFVRGLGSEKGLQSFVDCAAAVADADGQLCHVIVPDKIKGPWQLRIGEADDLAALLRDPKTRKGVSWALGQAYGDAIDCSCRSFVINTYNLWLIFKRCRDPTKKALKWAKVLGSTAGRGALTVRRAILATILAAREEPAMPPADSPVTPIPPNKWLIHRKLPVPPIDPTAIFSSEDQEAVPVASMPAPDDSAGGGGAGSGSAAGGSAGGGGSALASTGRGAARGGGPATRSARRKRDRQGGESRSSKRTRAESGGTST